MMHKCDAPRQISIQSLFSEDSTAHSNGKLIVQFDGYQFLKVLTATLAGRPAFEADDQSALIYLLLTQKARWSAKVPSVS